MEGSFSSPEGQPASRAAFRRFPLCPALPAQLREQKEPVVGNVPVPGVCDAGLWLLTMVGIDH
jgi:hypothetical protein